MLNPQPELLAYNNDALTFNDIVTITVQLSAVPRALHERLRQQPSCARRD